MLYTVATRRWRELTPLDAAFPTWSSDSSVIYFLSYQQNRHLIYRVPIATGKAEAPANLPAGTTPIQLAAYTVVSRVLLNLDETITKE